MIQENRLDKQGSLLVLCPSCEVTTQILLSYTTTTVALESCQRPNEIAPLPHQRSP